MGHLHRSVRFVSSVLLPLAIVGLGACGGGSSDNPCAVDGTTCDDGNACTTADHCMGGACVGGSPVVCKPLDDCHEAGVCDSKSGACTTPVRADGAACSDGNACTRKDACKAGVCVGGDAVTCVALDGCHDAGTCDPKSGACSTPAKADGTACDDGDLCTPMDTCQKGACAPGTPVACAAMDQCHVAGVCDPKTGMCSTPNQMEGAPCDDGDLCTQMDRCERGACIAGTPVACAALDQCHEVGVCDPKTGTCSNPASVDGRSCNDGSLCTRLDSCKAGVCTGDNPIVCAALDQCHVAGVCDPKSGACSNPGKPDGTMCNDSLKCTTGDVCVAGVCKGAAVKCAALDVCHDAGLCDANSGVCSNPWHGSPVWQGEAFVTDANSIDKLLCITEVTGGLHIDGGTLVASVKLPRLATVGGYVNVVNTTMVTDVDLTGITRTGGYVYVQNNAKLGGVTFSLQSLDYLFVNNNGALQNLLVPALATTTGGVYIDLNPALALLDLSSLATVGGELRIKGQGALVSFATPKLTQIGGYLRVVENPLLADVDFSSLSTIVGGYVYLSDNPKLSKLNLPISQVDYLYLQNDGALASFDMSKLQTITGYMYVDFDSALADFKLPQLGRVDGMLYFRNDPKLDACKAKAILTQVIGKGNPGNVTWSGLLGNCP